MWARWSGLWLALPAQRLPPSFWPPPPPPPHFVVFPGVQDDKQDAGDAKYQWPDDSRLVVPLTIVFEEVEVRTVYTRHGWRGEE